jgi:hypothetical protein
MSEINLNELSDEYKLSPAVPEELPHSSYWPVMLALSVVFFFWGFITSLIISGVGLITMGVSIWGWIGDLVNE